MANDTLQRHIALNCPLLFKEIKGKVNREADFGAEVTELMGRTKFVNTIEDLDEIETELRLFAELDVEE